MVSNIQFREISDLFRGCVQLRVYAIHQGVIIGVHLQSILTLDPDYIEKRSYCLSPGQQLNSNVYLYVYANSQAAHYSVFLFPISHTPHSQTALSAPIVAHLCL